MNGWFILPNWVFYFAQFISIPHIGIIDGVSKLVSVVLEVPSGAVSDLLGKKNTLIFGNAALIASCLILTHSTHFVPLLIGNIVMFVGFAFISGSKEALLYDSLKDIREEKQYNEVLGKVTSIATFATIVSIFLGGLLYRFSPNYPFYAWMITCGLAIVTLMLMQEPTMDDPHVSLSAYLSKLRTGVHSIFTKPVLSFILPVLFFTMLARSYEGVVRQTTGAYFGFNGETFGYVLALIFLPTLLVSYNYRWIAQKLGARIEWAIAALYLFSFMVVAITSSMAAGIAAFLVLYVAQWIAEPYVLGLVNTQTESRHRSTALSTVSLLSQVPYIVVVLFFGSLLHTSTLPFVYGILSLITLTFIGIRYFTKARQVPGV